MKLKFWIWVMRKTLRLHRWLFYHEKDLKERIELNDLIREWCERGVEILEENPNKEVKKLLSEMMDQMLEYALYNATTIIKEVEAE